LALAAFLAQQQARAAQAVSRPRPAPILALAELAVVVAQWVA
jgi:hypothetical protein